MLFNSIGYAFFLPIIFVLYWVVLKKSLKAQNILLMLASYYFYSCWDWRFLFLLIFSTLLDYSSGIMIAKSESKIKKKIWLILSIGLNLSFLGIFKYYNFFIESFAGLLHGFGLQPHYSTLSIILPVGISFYTFHGLSYVLDIYHGKIKPTYNLVNYTLFVSFFPLLVAGPIERATHLLPQVEQPRSFSFDKAADGLRQILWGLFKKVVIADNCAHYADLIFSNHSYYQGSTLVLGAILFAFQIYCDFSGYSDIALGSARLLGFELLKNFNFPYFSRDIAEFWRRWHISLSTWFRDYLYIPLGGSKGGVWIRVRNTFIIFLVSGFWHGANWTFIAWGGLNAVFIMPSVMMKTNRSHLGVVAQNNGIPSIKELCQIILTFSLATFAWIFFRSENLGHAFGYIAGIFSKSFFTVPSVFPVLTILLLIFFIIIEWFGRESNYAIERIGKNVPVYMRFVFYYILIASVFVLNGGKQEFIYFQF